jgi:hypothetical protein
MELYDLTDGTWKRFAHVQAGTRIAIGDPARYVDPGTGTVLIRLINEGVEGVGFGLNLSITGDVR